MWVPSSLLNFYGWRPLPHKPAPPPCIRRLGVGSGAMAKKGILTRDPATIPIDTSSSPGRPNGSKVTLTNWKRVANTPFEISSDGPVQAVHWRDYVVLFDVRRTKMYLYHHRCRIWSGIYTCSHDLSNMGWCSISLETRPLPPQRLILSG